MTYEQSKTKISLRLDKDLYEHLRLICHQRSTSMHNLVVSLCREATISAQFPRLTNEQLTELERQLIDAEKENAQQMHMNVIKKGPALTNIEFKATEYIRRLIEDVKAYRIALSEKANAPH